MQTETRKPSDPMDAFKKALERAKQGLEVSLQKKGTIRSERAELFKELYSHYESCYKKGMWSDYRKWLGMNRYKHSVSRVEDFKRSKGFRKQIEIGSFCSYWLGFLSTEDLYYLISIAKDKANRGENFNKWLFWAIKSQKE